MLNLAHELRFSKIGDDVTIWPGAKIISPDVIAIGDSVIIDDFVLLMGGKETQIGSFVHIASFTSITGGGVLVVEDFAGISSGCRVFTGNDDYLGGSLTGPTIPSAYRTTIRSHIHIGRHAIIGANTVILPGVAIGEGVAVGANSLIKTDLEPWTVYVGSPVRPVKKRPKDQMLILEQQLRNECYDNQGKYIPKRSR